MNKVPLEFTALERVARYTRCYKPFAEHYINENNLFVVKTDFVEQVAKECERLPPFVLVTGYSDYPITEKHRWIVESQNVLRWYGWNMMLVHEKARPLPIGMWRGSARNRMPSLVERDISSLLKRGKSRLLHSRYTIKNNPRERELCATCTGIRNPVVSYEQNLMEVADSLFCIAPEGNGMDCHRVWEAMALKSIPIITRNPMVNMGLYEGLPILIINSWREYPTLTLNREVYEEMWRDVDLDYNRWIVELNTQPTGVGEESNCWGKSHVNKAIANAERHYSKMTEGALLVEGYSSPKVRHFLNNLLSLESARYLEIGSWKGSTLVASLQGNEATVVDAVAIDNFSQLGGPRALLLKNMETFLCNYGPKLTFIEGDCWEVAARLERKFNIYFYDGAHTEEDHWNAFVKIDRLLEDTFIAVIDDWNWQKVRDGTWRAFKDLKYDVVAQWTLPAAHNADVKGYWNGIFVAIVSKCATRNLGNSSR